MEDKVAIGIIKKVSDGNLYKYLMMTEIMTTKNRKKTDDSKRVFMGRFPDIELSIIRYAPWKNRPDRTKKLVSLLLNLSGLNMAPISHIESRR
ncbi:MAG: hypothetical protein ACE5KZ_03115 [Candidatus Scalinduaceae bacterium]